MSAAPADVCEAIPVVGRSGDEITQWYAGIDAHYARIANAKDRMPHADWPEVVRMFSPGLAWTDHAARHDLRWHAACERSMGRRTFPTVSFLSRRWGWSRTRANQLVSRTDQWQDPEAPVGVRTLCTGKQHIAGTMPSYSPAPGKRRVPRVGLSSRTRFAVLSRDGHACVYCGARAPAVALHVDHVMPRSAGGTDSLDNLVTSCADCNLGKADKIMVPS